MHTYISCNGISLTIFNNSYFSKSSLISFNPTRHRVIKMNLTEILTWIITYAKPNNNFHFQWTWVTYDTIPIPVKRIHSKKKTIKFKAILLKILYHFSPRLRLTKRTINIVIIATLICRSEVIKELLKENYLPN